MTKENILNLIKHNRAPIAAHAIHAILDKQELENKRLLKENSELKERWRKTHEPSELRVQLARALEEIAELKRRAFDNEEYSKHLSQRITCDTSNDAPYLKL